MSLDCPFFLTCLNIEQDFVIVGWEVIHVPLKGKIMIENKADDG